MSELNTVMVPITQDSRAQLDDLVKHYGKIGVTDKAAIVQVAIDRMWSFVYGGQPNA